MRRCIRLPVRAIAGTHLFAAKVVEVTHTAMQTLFIVHSSASLAAKACVKTEEQVNKLCAREPLPL